jgi:hypothetical protein
VVSVYVNRLACLDDLGGGADVDDGGETVLAGDDRAVGEDAAQVYDHAGGGEQEPRAFVLNLADRGCPDEIEDSASCA